eukprot:7543198-Pyramimonas_sp.AAC.1
MATFDITDSGSDASEVQTQSPEIRDQSEHRGIIFDAASSKSSDDEPTLFISQPGKEPAISHWNGGKLILENCCGPHRKIGNSINFADNSCRVIRYTESVDMRTDGGKNNALTDIKEFNGIHISPWGSIPCTG